MDFELKYSSISQDDLDKEYSPSHWVRACTPSESISNHVNRLSVRTAEAKSSVSKAVLDISFDVNHPKSTIHFFYPNVAPEKEKSVPIVIYIHGGYWSSGVLEDAGAFMYKTVVKANNCTLATVQYCLSPPNRIDTIVSNVRKAVSFIDHENPCRPLYLVGHSAGGHLAAMVLATNWNEFGYKMDTHPNIKGCISISGIYDLEPIRLSCVNVESGLMLSSEEVKSCSPCTHISAIQQLIRSATCEFWVAVGEYDSPQFVAQSLHFYEKMAQNMEVDEVNGSNLIHFVKVDNKDHFTVAEELYNTEYELSKLLEAMIRRA